MKRRPFIGVLALWPWSQALLAPALFAQVAAGRYTLGYLDQGSMANGRDPENALPVLLKALSGFGYVKGRNLKALFGGMANERDQAVLVWGNPHLNLHRPQIAELALRTRMPVLYDVRYPSAPSNELMLYSPNILEVWREAATYVDRIFRGAKPGDLPIGQARVFELVINLRVAKAIGLAIPKSVLMRADEVIE